MPRLPEFVKGTVGGVPGPFEDAQTELGLDQQLWAQVVALLTEEDSILRRALARGGTLTVTGTSTVVGGTTTYNLTIS